MPSPTTAAAPFRFGSSLWFNVGKRWEKLEGGGATFPALRCARCASPGHGLAFLCAPGGSGFSGFHRTRSRGCSASDSREPWVSGFQLGAGGQGFCQARALPRVPSRGSECRGGRAPEPRACAPHRPREGGLDTTHHLPDAGAEADLQQVCAKGTLSAETRRGPLVWL